MAFTTPYRKCPEHGNDLELFGVRVSGEDEYTNYSCPKKWYCEKCDGYWNEFYFHQEFEKTLPSRVDECNFKAKCPKCSSTILERSCSISCCNQHQCQQCKHEFDIVLVEVQESPLSKEMNQELRGRVWLEDEAWLSTRNEKYFEHREDIGIYLECKEHSQCQRGGEDEDPMTLIVDHETNDERLRFWWYCSKCDFVFSDEACSRENRNWVFERSGTCIDIRCWNCHHPYFEQNEKGDGICTTCKMEFRIKYEK